MRKFFILSRLKKLCALTLFDIIVNYTLDFIFSGSSLYVWATNFEKHELKTIKTKNKARFPVGEFELMIMETTKTTESTTYIQWHLDLTNLYVTMSSV